MTLKVALYGRISTEKQDLSKQLSLLREYSERQGLEIYDEYVDVCSGSKDSRPEFNRLLSDMRHYKFNTVVVTKLDRIGRSLRHLVNLFDEFNKKGVGFVAITQNIDTTSASGRLQLHILQAFAEFERELISERTKEGLRKAKNVGKRGKDKKPRKKRGVLRKSRLL